MLSLYLFNLALALKLARQSCQYFNRQYENTRNTQFTTLSMASCPRAIKQLFSLYTSLHQRQQHETYSTSTNPAPHTQIFRPKRESVCSGSHILSRSGTSRTLIKAHPARPATKLRCVSIARHGTIIWTACGNSRRFYAFPVAITTAVTPAQKKLSASLCKLDSSVVHRS